jgi:ferritin-like metal-binding protein YciE
MTTSSRTTTSRSTTTARKAPAKNTSSVDKFMKAAGKEVREVKKALGLTPSHKTTNEAEDSKLHAFFLEELKDIYWAEKHLCKTLPKMKKAATSAKLQKAFADHLTQTENHVARLEQVFESLGQKAKGQKCEAMAGITAEGETIINDTEKGTATRDVGLILAAQKVEHYEIATYGGLAQLARTLGRTKAVTLLEKTLAEEKAADSLLTTIAENNVNDNSAREAA